jgi:xylulose-5-phosphate/fructose-6-phosphate phosphoketolase
MLLRNNVSRYHVAEAAINCAAKHNPKVELDMTTLLSDIRHQVKKVQDYIMMTGKDPEGTSDIPRFEGTAFEHRAQGSDAKDLKEDGFFVN